MRSPLQPLLLVSSLVLASSAVTIYYIPGQEPISAATSTDTSKAAAYTGSAAYDPKTLNPPPVPSGLTTQFPIQLQSGGNPAAISIPIPSNFYGFSIEFSVINQVIGTNSSFLHVPFLNLMSNIAKRAGGVRIRVGGNTQEFASLADTTPDGKMIYKFKELTDPNVPTSTPPTAFTREVLYMLANVSALVNTKWYLGIPFNDTNWRLGIATEGRRILGDNLLGLQAGNEPDQYLNHQHRPAGYNPSVYVEEMKSLLAAMSGEEHAQNRQEIIAPSISALWTAQDLWDTGFLDIFRDNLGAVSVERYPDNNCGAVFLNPDNPPRDPQAVFPEYLDHEKVTNLVNGFIPDIRQAQQRGKAFHMFETNTASCSGFPGISDSFGAALWALDYGLSMAANNFSGALLHVGGQASYYNPFTAAPTNQSTFRQWTIGPVYYSALIVAEALGPSNTTQVSDLGANSGNVFTPGYALYQGGNPVRLALFNYVTDPSGASTYTASVSVKNVGSQADETPTSIKIKRLSASSVSQKGNFTWGGQTFGGHFDSDGRLMGEETLETVQCANGVCPVTVPAPGFVLVYLSDNAVSDSAGRAATVTYATTAQTKTQNTATVDPSVLATSNGNKGIAGLLGSTSSGSNGAGRGAVAGIATIMLSTALVAGLALLGGFSR